VKYVAWAAVLTAAFCGMAEPPDTDWPVWRGDCGHTGVTRAALPKNLTLQWTRTLPPLERAWPDDARLEFDVAYEPVAAGGMLYIASPRTDAVLAFDAATGEERWRFYAGAPIRFAPAIAEGLLYAGADDGFLYCLDAATGALTWKYRAALGERRLLGNTRMMSVWPVRGAPVVADGIVYIAAGIWPFEGVSVYALDAKTGAVRWINDNCDVKYMLQPHHSPAFSGLAPQGYLTVAGDSLLVPNGRAPAACFDRATGELRLFDLANNNRSGDYRVATNGEYYFNPSVLYRLKNAQNMGGFAPVVALTENIAIGLDDGKLRAFAYADFKISESADKRGRKQYRWEAPPLWTLDVPGMTNIILAGPRLYGCKPGGMLAIEVPKGKGDARIAWEMPVDGDPVRLMAAGGRLYATTLQGNLYCFGGKEPKGQPPVLAPDTAPAPDAAATADARALLAATGVTEGYALVLADESAGLPAPGFLSALARESELRIVTIGGTAESRDAARRALDAAGVYGARVAVLEDVADLAVLPAYFASVAVVNAGAAWAADAARVAALYERLRPYGGVACLAGGPELGDTLAKTVTAAGLHGAQVDSTDGRVLLRRTGALPGSADWTHQYADASNTVVSQDASVRAPLGMLWFGGSSNKDILPRHGHGPSEHVVEGRLFIEGPDMIRAVDVYTGRVLWQVSLPELGKAYDNTNHQPGANAIGSNYVTVPDGIYIAYGTQCLRLDPATGRKLSEWMLPIPEGASEPPEVGRLAIWEDLLVAGSGPMRYDDEIHGETWNAVASKRLVVMNRHTGEVLWTRTADAAFRHNAIAIGAGKIFCIDRSTNELRERLARRGITLPQDGRMYALDVRTGSEAWHSNVDIFGTWLSYSPVHDMLLEAGNSSRDSLEDEPDDRMRVLKGCDGSVVWERKFEYEGPCMLHGDMILAQEKLVSLLTGEPIQRKHPLTDRPLEMSWERQHGCNTAIASANLVTFRSAAAGFFDLSTDGGTGNLGGFRSGCTSNLIAANGVLNAPDYTRTCTCSYQNQTSLALVHMPGVDMWTFNAFDAGDGPILRLGLNLGAPGDRRAANGTLWLEYPSVGGKSPDIPVTVEPAEPRYYRYHSLRVSGDGPAWIAASGAEGVRRLVITLDKGAKDAAPYTVRLHFAEPKGAQKGERLFDVSLQGRVVLQGFDVAGEAGGPMRALVKEFTGIPVAETLEIALEPKGKMETLLCGVEMIRQ